MVIFFFLQFSKSLVTVSYLHMILTLYYSDLLLATLPLNYWAPDLTGWAIVTARSFMSAAIPVSTRCPVCCFGFCSQMPLLRSTIFIQNPIMGCGFSALLKQKKHKSLLTYKIPRGCSTTLWVSAGESGTCTWIWASFSHCGCVDSALEQSSSLGVTNWRTCGTDSWQNPLWSSTASTRHLRGPNQNLCCFLFLWW